MPHFTNDCHKHGDKSKSPSALACSCMESVNYGVWSDIVKHVKINVRENGLIWQVADCILQMLCNGPQLD